MYFSLRALLNQAPTAQRELATTVNIVEKLAAQRATYFLSEAKTKRETG